MAIQWGNWDYSGGNGMRVGINVTVAAAGGGAINNGTNTARFTVEYYTDNQHSYGDGQSLNLGGSIGGSIGFTNNAGTGSVKRGEKTYDYDYLDSYGESPGSRTFSCTLNGAYNGVTPSRSVTEPIPPRPIAGPLAPFNAKVSRINDENNKVTWVSTESPARPWGQVIVEREIYLSDFVVVARLGGGSTQYTDSGAVPNRRYRYRVKSQNQVDQSSYDITDNYIYTSPGTPTNCVATISGADTVITFTNNVDVVGNAGYPAHVHEIWAAPISTGVYALAGTTAANQSTYTHTGSAATSNTYKVRAKTTLMSPVLYSSYSNESAATSGTTSIPSAPTNLQPSSNVLKDPSAQIELSWQHNPTDGTAQTQYQLQYRVNGGSYTVITSGTTASDSYTLAAGLFSNSQTIDWQVQTRGAHASFSAYSSLVTFLTTAAAPLKYPVYIDVATGRLEALSSGTTLNSYTAVATSGINPLTATVTDIPGVTMTVVSGGTAEKFLVNGSADLAWVSGTSSTAIVSLYIDGTEWTDPATSTINQIIMTASAVLRVTPGQHWLISGLSAGNHTFKLRGSSASGGVQVRGTHTKLTVVRLTA